MFWMADGLTGVGGSFREAIYKDGSTLGYECYRYRISSRDPSLRLDRFAIFKDTLTELGSVRKPLKHRIGKIAAIKGRSP